MSNDDQLTRINNWEVVDHGHFIHVHSSTKSAQFIIYIILTFLFVFFIWASFSNIDQSVRVTGQVIANDKIQQINSNQTGILEKIWVKEGDTVKKDQILFSIEPDRQKSAVDDGLLRAANLKLSISRLKAEIAGEPLTFQKDLAVKYPDIASNQFKLFQKRKKALEDELGAMKDSLLLAQDELKMYETLLKSGDISKSDILRLRRQLLDINSQIINRRNRFNQEAQTELARLEADLELQNQSQIEREIFLSHSKIHSPVDGVVNTLRTYTVGSMIREGEPVMQILPTDSELIIESKLQPSDISQVQLGQQALVKFDAYDYSVFGEFIGKVSYISADAITENTGRGEFSFYRVRVQIPKESLNGREKSISLRAGMSATVDFKSGNRTVMSYLTKPISKMMNESLHEK